ncbi:MAG: MEDS domain-containing protein [Planctomycetota bacterium]|jgi:hypothetical protein
MEKNDKIVEGARKMGNDVFGDVPWGIHVCQFYQTKEDLIDVLVPYFKAGLENNEFCMWITGELLQKNEIIRAMRRNLSQFEHFLITGQIEIIPYTKWFLTDDVFDQHRVLDAWMDKLEQALGKGYDGMRITGDFAPLIEGNWTNLIDYEAKVNDSIGENRMIGICTYPLVKCTASEVLDVIYAHQFMLTKRVGRWESREISLIEESKNDMQSLSYTADSSCLGCAADGDGVSASDGEGIHPTSRSKNIVISGYLASTEGVVAQNGLGYFCVDLEVDPVDFKIVDFACTEMGSLSKKILHEALLGYKVEEGVKNAIEQVEKRWSSPFKNGIIAAFEDANRWYEKMKEGKKGVLQQKY